MRRLATPLALVSSLLVGCGTMESTARTRVATERLQIAELPPADAPIDTRRGDSGRMRTTRVVMESGEVLTVPGDARLYRDGDQVLVQPGPTSLMVRQIPAEDVKAIEREDVWQEVTTVEKPPAPSVVPAAILGTIGALVLSYVVTTSTWANPRTTRTRDVIPSRVIDDGVLR
jgi:hypothetical protein